MSVGVGGWFHAHAFMCIHISYMYVKCLKSATYGGKDYGHLHQRTFVPELLNDNYMYINYQITSCGTCCYDYMCNK